MTAHTDHYTLSALTFAIILRKISSYIPSTGITKLHMTPLKAQAIQTALMGDWNNAVSINQLLLEENPNDIDTLNRLGFAHASLGNIKVAKDTYQKVLSLDNQNPIAIRNLKRLNGSAQQKSTQAVQSSNISTLFIEEPGKTKVVDLLNIADKKVISPLRTGERLTLSVKRMKIFIHDHNKQYIGMLPDDIGRRLIRFMDGGNQYDACVKSVDNNKVSIFAREVKRSKQYANQPSFPPTDKSKLLLYAKK